MFHSRQASLHTIQPILGCQSEYFILHCRKVKQSTQNGTVSMALSVCCNQCSNGKKESERSVSERRRREARRLRRRASSAEGARSFDAASGSGERCKLPERVRAKPGRQTTFGAFFGLKMLYMARPSMQLGRLGERCKLPQFQRKLGSLGSAVSSPSGSGRSPAAKRHLVHL